MKVDKFIIAIILAVLTAYFFPYLADPQSAIPLDVVSSIGVSLIFFFYGLKLDPEQLKAGLQNWRLHLLVQLTTFVIFPLIVLPFYFTAFDDHHRLIWLSFFFLAVMPSTVSSSVVMVAMAKGNVPAAIFNASISGIIGIVAAPLWLGLFISSNNGDASGLTDIYLRLSLEIIAPLIVGLILHRFWGGFAQRHSEWLSMFDRAVILLIIYKSFATSFTDKIFSNVSAADLAMIVAGVIILFYAVYFLTGYLSQLLGFSREDRITAQFCGTKKSLVHGTVFLKVIFGTAPSAGFIIIPLMVFHTVQIFIISVIAGRLGREADRDQDLSR